MTPQEEQSIIKWNDALGQNIRIDLIQTDAPLSEQISEFCRMLSTVAPKIEIRQTAAGHADMPGIKIRDNLIYHAIPLGKELAPFLEALALQVHNDDQPANDELQELKAVREALDIQIFIARQCPHCPLIVRRLLPLAMVNPLIRVTVIDGMLFPELAASNNILSVPTIVMDDRRWTGSTNLQEIVDVILKKDAENLSSSSLIQMLEEGKAAELAGMMLEKGMIFESFLEILVHAKWSVRLGAIVVVETLVEENYETASQLVEPLWQRYLSAADDGIRGDLIYVFGELGDQRMASKLEALLPLETNADVKEALNEALESIAARHKEV